MKTSEIRRAFLDYFAEHGHAVVESSSLVPANDPSLLFTNAGMVQFKDVFLGLEERPYRRAASSQRCVRAGGKHNDLDNVGYTARHHTFFEMLGNFSFGEYFKRDAIQFAWGLLVGRFGLPPERLWITVFENDDEAASIWLDEIGVSPERFSRCGEKDNFWMMGDTGPCGPCSEIFYDHGPEIPGGPPGSADADGDRYIEIWNLVFMQYERLADGSQRAIPRPSVDTGMGLERIAAVMQGVHDNYDIDLFRNLISAVRAEVDGEVSEPASLRVIADHIRSGAFLVLDGVLPSNEGRGYVLRRIIRRALRHGHKLGIERPFFHRLVAPLAAEMGDAYPALAERAEAVATVLAQEEARFAETLDQGMRILEQAIANLEGDIIPGAVVFQLYDTYGFPVDLTADIARERSLRLDQAGFEAAMQVQRERARAASHFANVDTAHAIAGDALAALGREQVFTGYDSTRDKATVVGLFVDGKAVDAVTAGTAAVVVLDRTPFYAESGGQVGDRGVLEGDEGAAFVVADTRKQGGLFLHVGQQQQGSLARGARVVAAVEDPRRQATRRNHSATHLMHAALREVLGKHVEQKGSLVDHERLRFDFSHPQPLTRDELDAVERLVNGEIRRNVAVEARLMSYDTAIKSGAMALFGEKYGDEVRVLAMGDFSVELCGGTHVERTGDIGAFRIVAEAGVASGVRRIEAVTGEGAVEHALAADARIARIAGLVRAGGGDVEHKIGQILERTRTLEKEIQELRNRLAGESGRDLAAGAHDVGGITVIAECVAGADMNTLRAACDKLKDRFERAVIVLAAVEDDKVRLVAGVTKPLVDTVHAGKLVNHVAQQVGGKGGGRADMAQAGGTDAGMLEPALASVTDWVATAIA
ncbi:MAG: alanine--tRNA ligase [Gammaproteobacteria bacterium]|nr:alanine--tRNA ligase [Gammaproteobacteria bacterium]